MIKNKNNITLISLALRCIIFFHNNSWGFDIYNPLLLQKHLWRAFMNSCSLFFMKQNAPAGMTHSWLSHGILIFWLLYSQTCV